MIARITQGVAANGFGQIVTIASQVVSVPLLIGAWGASGYGAWVVLTAIPTALAFADGGLAVAGGNAMTMMVARGDTAGAAALFRTVSRTVSKTCVGLAAVMLLAIWSVGDLAQDWLPLAGGRRIALGAVALTVLVGTLATLPSAALRAGGSYALSVATGTIVRLAETAAILVTAMAGGGPAQAAITWLLVRVAGALWLMAIARWRLPWLRDGGATADLRPLLAPAAASLAMPAAFAAGLQGVTIAIGAALTPDAVALFTATRTLARASVQLSGLVNHALMPEMARLAGRGDSQAMRAVARFNRLSCGLLLGLGWSATLAFGPAILAAWTGGRLRPDMGLLGLVATAALLHGLWLGPANLLLAVNRQAAFAWSFLGSALAVACLAGPVARAAGLHGVATLVLAGEALMVLQLWSRGRLAATLPALPEGAPS